MADYGSGTRVRFRYTGLTTSAAQWLDDAAGTVTRSIANGWLGERLADWTGSGSNLRIYGTNGHHDVTWLASSTGTVSQALRYDPWGNPRASVPSGYTPFRFQGAWFDAATSLNWVITRWYAPGLGRFISEDTLLGIPTDPPSRHLYAYAAGEPITRWDPDGRCAMTAVEPIGVAGQWAACLLELGGKAAGVAVGVGVFIVTIPFVVTGDTAREVPRPRAVPQNKVPKDRSKGCFVIGENQTRVNLFARPRGCSTMIGLPSSYPHATKLFYNGLWVSMMMVQKKKLFDCGRWWPKLSDFYALERRMLVGYPRTYVKTKCDAYMKAL